MNNLNKDIFTLLAMELDYDDIMKFCTSSKKINNAVCKNNDFWRNKFHQKYFFKASSNNFRQLYKIFNNTIPLENEIFNLPLFITSELLDFFSNADFGNYPIYLNKGEDKLPIRDIISPLLNLKIMSRGIITYLFHIYFNIHKDLHLDNNFYKADETMKKYLPTYKLNEKFRFNQFLLPITSRGIEHNLTDKQKLLLKDPKIIDLVSRIKEIISFVDKYI